MISEAMDMATEETPIWKQLSLGTWLAIIGTFIVVVGAITGGYSYVFATKGELKAVELKQADTGDKKLTEWRLKTLEVQMANAQMRSERMDRNIVALMQRFRVEPEPTPKYQPLPEPPKPDEKSSP